MAADIFDEIAPAQKRDAFDEIDVFDSIEADPGYDRAEGDAQPQAAPYVIASPEQATAAIGAMTAVDASLAPYRLDTSDLTADRVMEAYVEKDKLEREGIRWIGGFGAGGERPDTERSFALKPGVKGTPELLERANWVKETLAKADAVERATPEWQQREAARVAGAADSAVRESPLGNPNIFLERMGMNALPAAGALGGARMMMVKGAEGIQKLLPFAGAAVGGSLVGATQEKVRQIGETPEDTASRQQGQAMRGETAEAKMADLASMGLLFGPSRNLAEVGVGAGVGVGFAGANAALEGRLPTPEEMGKGFVEGAAFSGAPTRLARGILGSPDAPLVKPEVEARANVRSILEGGEPVSDIPSVSSNTPLQIRQRMRALSPDEAIVVATGGIDALPSVEPSAPTKLFRSEKEGDYANPNKGAIFYTADPTYAEIYHGEGRVMREAEMPENVFDIRDANQRKDLRSWVEQKADEIEQSEPVDGYPSGVKRFLSEAKKKAAVDTPESISSAMANLGLAVNKIEGTGMIAGTAEKLFMESRGVDAMTVAENARNVGEEFSVAFREPPQRNLGPGAANIEEPLRTGGTVAAYNAAVDANRVSRGLEPLMALERKPDDVTWDNMERRIDADPVWPERLVNDLNTGKKTSVSDEEQSALLWREIDLKTKATMEYERLADESLTPEERLEAESNANLLEKQLSEWELANQKAGSQSGRSLRSRRFEANEDFTLAGLMGRRRTAKKEPLTPEERTEITEQFEKMDAARKGLPEIEAAADEKASRTAAEDAITDRMPYSERFTRWAESKLKEFDLEAEQGFNDLKALMGYTSANPFQPKAIAALYKIARAKIARTGYDLGRFTAEMVGHFGESVRPYIEPAWNKGLKFFDVDTTPKGVAKRERAAAEALSTEDGIKAVVAGGETKLDTLAPYIKKLADEYVDSGARTPEAVESRLHEFFALLIPDVTPRQLRDVWTNYGKSKVATTDPIKVARAQIKSEGQKLSALEDLQKKLENLELEGAKRTGQQPVGPSDRSRRLTKEINNVKKKIDLKKAELGIKDEDTAKQLRSTLQTAETRLRNRLTDLRFEIAKRERTIKQKAEQPTSPAIEALKKELAEVQAEHEAIFGKREATPEQRLKAALKAAERAEADASAELADAKKGIFRKKEKGKPAAPEVAAIRARAEAAREETNTLRMLTDEGKADAQKVAVQAYKTRQRGRAAEYAERVARGDFEQRKRTPLDISKDPEAVKLKSEADVAKKDFERKQFEWQQANRSEFKKFTDGVVDVLGASRSLKTSMDVSAPLRQGGMLSIGDLVFNPRRFFRQFGAMMKSFGSKKTFDEIQASISLRPNADLYKESGLALTDLGTGMTAREENMRSLLAEKVPGVKASNRAYTAFLNQQRAEAFDAFVDMMGGRDAVTQEQAKFFADAINDMTGRGSLPKSWLGAANAFAKILFSPRFLLSRINVLMGRPVFRGALAGPAVGTKARALVAAEYGKFAVGMAAFLGLAKLAGADINLDPRSTDFLKIKLGNTRIDVLTGLQQVGVFLSRMLTGKQTTTDGKKRDISGSTIGNFIRGKLAPIPGTTIDVALGKNVVGEEVTPTSAAINMVSPLSFQPDQLQRLYKEQGPLKASAIQLLSLMGAGVNTYEKR